MFPFAAATMRPMSNIKCANSLYSLQPSAEVRAQRSASPFPTTRTQTDEPRSPSCDACSLRGRNITLDISKRSISPLAEQRKNRLVRQWTHFVKHPRSPLFEEILDHHQLPSGGHLK